MSIPLFGNPIQFTDYLDLNKFKEAILSYKKAIDLKANNDEKFLTVEQFELNILLMGQFLFDYSDINKYRPHDVGMNKSHVSFSKGCFRGQEVIARTEHLNKKKKEILPIESKDEANIDSKKIETLKEISFEKDIFKLVSFIPN